MCKYSAFKGVPIQLYSVSAFLSKGSHQQGVSALLSKGPPIRPTVKWRSQGDAGLLSLNFYMSLALSSQLSMFLKLCIMNSKSFCYVYLC